MVSRVIPVEPFDLVIFGITGDLARRKILPALYRRFIAGQVSAEARIIGAARSPQDSAAFRDEARAAITDHSSSPPDAGRLSAFLDLLEYVPIDATSDAGWDALKALMRPGLIHAFYFSVAPSLFGALAERLARHGIADAESRVVVEKPFGRDLESARALNATLARHFSEQQIYRIDHYLGKETVQNLMAVRFANMLFEPLWNARHVDHVQITVAETVGVAGRGEYYDRAGAVRDMVQNHLMQLLCLIALEPPWHFEADAVRDEKLKVIRALAPLQADEIVHGQYRGYDDDAGVAHSHTATFVALRVSIANWRWSGTPFYLRTGKKLRERTSEIAVVFKKPPHSIFDDDHREGTPEPDADSLVIRLQPNEGMNLKLNIKEPGPGGMRLVQVPLDMSFAEVLGDEGTDMPDAYERLIMDVIRGNQTLFMRGDEVEAAWAWIDPIIAAWEAGSVPPAPYDPGSAGPDEALRLMQDDNRRWREIRA